MEIQHACRGGAGFCRVVQNEPIREEPSKIERKNCKKIVCLVMAVVCAIVLVAAIVALALLVYYQPLPRKDLEVIYVVICLFLLPGSFVGTFGFPIVALAIAWQVQQQRKAVDDMIVAEQAAAGTYPLANPDKNIRNPEFS